MLRSTSVSGTYLPQHLVLMTSIPFQILTSHRAVFYHQAWTHLNDLWQANPKGWGGGSHDGVIITSMTQNIIGWK